ncbi:hypothetical protein ASF21_00320 [Arthrobacter sp. Leaf234]|uniref:hypothetical protein n=1 Tax=Arthrobacter sp. Leaf234 TaxID=1736303 RepID=UPI0006F27EEE|nr:hypothetical protein [Arthrobacter sp. Leaf234]KQO02847.1 hypothetical protein ASF21_00320 [Arthrobacter sp. Leaf234]
MTRGTNGQPQSSPRSRTRSSLRDALIYGLAGAMLALAFVMTVPTVGTWSTILGTCVIGLMAVVCVAKAIIALRQD